MTRHLTVKLSTTRKSLPWTAAPDHDLRVIGTVSRGPEFGYLAITHEGQYLKVNGSVTQPLNTWQVREAIRSAGGQLEAVERAEAPKISPGPVVILRKKRRVLAQEGVAA